MGKIVGNQLVGKVKTVTFLKQATPEEFGEATFTFRDEYSVFDYGRMPDDVPAKGESLCRMSAQNFEELEKQGIKTHYLGVAGPKTFRVKISQVLYPQKGELKPGSKNYLIPLEIIFRNSLPEGSSMLKRLRSGKLKPEELGLSEVPQAGYKFEKPLVDYTTKLEESDRHLSLKESRELALLSDRELGEMEEIALKVNEFLNKKAESVGLEHADGKIEMALGPSRELLLVDTFGTLDEDRFLYDGVHLSKQVMRDYYAKTVWAEAVEKKEQGLPFEFSKPEKMPPELLEIVSNMYKSVCEAWIGKKIWNSPPIAEVVHSIEGYMEKLGGE